MKERTKSVYYCVHCDMYTCTTQLNRTERERGGSRRAGGRGRGAGRAVGKGGGRSNEGRSWFARAVLESSASGRSRSSAEDQILRMVSLTESRVPAELQGRVQQQGVTVEIRRSASDFPRRHLRDLCAPLASAPPRHANTRARSLARQPDGLNSSSWPTRRWSRKRAQTRARSPRMSPRGSRRPRRKRD